MRGAWLLFKLGILAVGPLGSALPGAGAQQAGIRTLEPGAAIVEPLAGSAPRLYVIRMGADTVADLRVEPQGIDLAVEVEIGRSADGQAGKPSASSLLFDALPTDAGGERLVLRSDRERDIALRVRAVDETASPGSYCLVLLRVAPAGDVDRTAAEASSLVAEATALRQVDRPESLTRAIALAGRAAELWRAQSDADGEGRALLERARSEDGLSRKKEAVEDFLAAARSFRLAGNESGEALASTMAASLHNDLGDTSAALAVVEGALRGFRQLNDRKGLAWALDTRGSIHNLKGELDLAQRDYEESLGVSGEGGDRLVRSLALNDVARTLSKRSKPKEALPLYEEALLLVEALGDWRSAAWVLNNIGVEYSRFGRVDQALEHYQRSALVLHEVGDLAGEALTAHNLSALQFDTGDLQGAIENERLALSRWKEIGDRRLEGRGFLGLGRLYSVLGESEKAFDAYDEAMRLADLTQDSEGKASIWLGRGWEHTSLGKFELAEEELNRRLSLWRSIGSPRREASALINLAELRADQGQPGKGVEVALQAVALRRQANDRSGEATARQTLAKCQIGTGALEEAEANLRAVLPVREESRDWIGAATTHYQLARTLRKGGDLAGARRESELALRLLDDVRRQILSADLKASLVGALDSYYRLAVDLLMEEARRTGNRELETEAFEANEMRRARGLRDALLLSNTEVRLGVVPELFERKSREEKNIAMLDLRLRNAAKAGLSAAELTALQGELDDRLLELAETREEIAKRSPDYAALMQPTPPRVVELLRCCISGDDNLLEIMLGDERSFAWILSREGLATVELPPGATIEKAARAFRDALVRSRDRLGRTAYEAAGRRLASYVLSPLRGRLGKGRLLIVAAGTLEWIPWGLLPESSSRKVPYRRLLAGREVVALPSAAVLAALRRRPRPPASGRLAVLADPVVESSDPRLGRRRPRSGERADRGSPPPDGEDGRRESLHRAVVESGDGPLRRLPFSALEAQAIRSLVPARSLLVASGFAADRELLRSDQLRSYSLLHFATHSLLNPRHPELSGLVLSLYDRKGEPRDGFVRVEEIYNLDLPADLVVLSSCRSALGKAVRGEGMVGLTRAFFYAGASSVISSLWPVDDRATAELMRRFYQELLQRKRGPAAALRQAQLSMSRHPVWSAPYYWGGFVLHGEWDHPVLNPFPPGD